MVQIVDSDGTFNLNCPHIHVCVGCPTSQFSSDLDISPNVVRGANRLLEIEEGETVADQSVDFLLEQLKELKSDKDSTESVRKR